MLARSLFVPSVCRIVYMKILLSLRCVSVMCLWKGRSLEILTQLVCQLMMVYDEFNRFVGASDAWPEELKLPKGKNTVVMQIRGASASSLRPFVGMVR